MSRFVIGIDIGGSGSRAALAAYEEEQSTGRRVVDTFTGPRIEVGSGGRTVLEAARGLVDSAASTWADQLAEDVGIGVGATGIGSLSAGPAGVLAELPAEVGSPAVAATDAVPPRLGALGGRGGAITVLGTGAIAIGHPGSDDHGHWCPDWLRVDGW